jgi:hypothetical protein
MGPFHRINCQHSPAYIIHECFTIAQPGEAFGEEHLLRILKRYFLNYHNSRPHQALDQNAPIPRTVESGKKGPVISIPEVGGLHHRYQRAA